MQKTDFAHGVMALVESRKILAAKSTKMYTIIFRLQNPQTQKQTPRERPLIDPKYDLSLPLTSMPNQPASSPHQFCTLSASALHCTSPTTLLNSSSVDPILTTEYLNILGSRPRVLRTACCVLALESKRTTK